MSDVSAPCAPQLPDCDALRVEFDQAVAELREKGLTNPNINTPWYASIGDSVFDACYRALEDACHPDANKGIPGTPHVPPASRGRLHVVSAPVGSGKTSFSVAFIVATVRYAERNGDMAPYGCAFIADQMDRADQVYKDLDALIPGKVAIWTTEHDPGCKVREKVPNPAATYTKEQLKEYPVAVVTHKFFGGQGSRMATHILKHGREQRRALTVVDEYVEEVAIYDVELADAQAIREAVHKDREVADTIGPHLDALVDFMHKRSMVSRRTSLEKPSTDPQAWSAADDLQWFRSQQAANYIKSHHVNGGVRAVFGFAKALATGYAFITRPQAQGLHYIGYESNLVVSPGTVLLDATSDIDGISHLCPWREHQEIPHAHYDNLHIVHVAHPPERKTKNTTAYLKDGAKNKRAYAAWVQSTVMAHMQPGQKGLVVVKQELIKDEYVPTWPVGDPRHKALKSAYTEDWGWDVEGRKLCVIHWGTGIGQNRWKDADVVFLFDDFVPPRRTVIATAQGLREHKSTEGDLGRMKTHNSKAPAVDILQEGHALRWMKQMALRGKARDYDEHGYCQPQKLVYCGSSKNLLKHADTLFPGARIEYVGNETSKQTQMDAVLSILSRPDLPPKLTQNWLGQQLKRPWREVSQHLIPREDFHKAISAFGWKYVPRKGRGGSYFERIGSSAPLLPMAA